MQTCQTAGAGIYTGINCIQLIGQLLPNRAIYCDTYAFAILDGEQREIWIYG